ncbi:MAG: hypothetical protein APR53_08655 [Methanoculleus sp. SDB]|nr:MAG: hypothetical protein APR53_08655 [Methanoculleus sp. SDB]
MDLRTKTLISFNITLIIIIVITLILSSTLFLTSYTQLEEEQINKDLARVRNLMDIQIEDINRICGDYASWDDTYAYVSGDKADYVAVNFVAETYENLGINVILVSDSHMHIIYEGAYDPGLQSFVPVPENLRVYLDYDSPLYHDPLSRTYAAGIISLPEGPMLITSRPVLTSDQSGPPNGFFIMGAYLDDTRITALSDAIGLPVSISAQNDRKFTKSVEPRNEWFSTGFTPFEDILGNEAFVISIEEPRDIYNQGKNTLASFIFILLLFGLISGILTVLVIDRSLLSRLSLLATHVSAIGTDGDVSRRVESAGDDELSHLGEAINRMLATIEQIQETLQESEARYRGIVNDQMEFICRYRPDGVVTFVNDIFSAYVDVPASSIVGRKFTQTLLSDDLPLFQEALTAVTPDAPATDVEFRVIHHDGAVRWQRWAVRAIFSQTDRISEYQLIGQDITELKNAEEALRESQRMLSTLMSNLPGMVYRGANDSQWTMTFVSDGARDLTGYEPEELTGSGRVAFEDLIHPEDIPDVWKTIRDGIAERAPFAMNYRIITHSGKEKWVRELGRGVYGKDGELRALEGFIMDITAIKKSRDAISEANKKLNLLNNITRHDILNQLTALLGYIELSRSDITDEGVRHYFEKMERAARTIHEQILFTRDYQQLGVMGAQWSPVRSAISEGMARLDLSTIRLSVDVDDIRVFADPLLFRVFYNLAHNSLIHGGPGLSEIRISGHETERGYLLLYDDDGEGISREDKDKIFNAGYGKVTGYGLFLIREILAITGIGIRESGEEGEGARFEILIPPGAYRLAAGPEHA